MSYTIHYYSDDVQAEIMGLSVTLQAHYVALSLPW
jgi:hypothetical protein